jgi:hypothetical protein
MGAAGGQTRGEVNYIRNPQPEGAAALIYVTEDESQSTMITLPGQPVVVHDMRGKATSLDREGFELVPHSSTVTDFHRIEEDPATDQLYIGEMTALLQQLTGAAVVIMQGGGKKRYGPSAKGRLAGLHNALPALYPHGDTTDTSAVYLAEAFAAHIPGFELGQAKRWAHFNMWRPITPPPQDYPLALCDARSIAPGDGVTVVAETLTRTTGAFSFDTTGYLHNPAHRWCYFRHMTPGEVIVFKTHDSDPARAHQVAHTAFLDPACPAGTPTRASVEMRAFAVFD